MLERRELILGEKMSENDCQFAGLIGQVAVMARMGSFYEHTELPVADNMYVALLRGVCRRLAAGKFLDVRDDFAKLNGDYIELGSRLNLNPNGKGMHEAAEEAFTYHARQSSVILPSAYRNGFSRLVTYVTNTTRDNVKQVIELDQDPHLDGETVLFARAGADIGFYATDLRPGE